ncbi:hypothetical protein EON65_18370 [archaeon]|nr:MAG: hypothetical protein EON65_18370 [archaeon]
MSPLHLVGISSRLLLTIRGTYTTQAKGKKENRRSEILMREAEYAAIMASLVDPDYTYPKKVSCLLCADHKAYPVAIRRCLGGYTSLSVPRCLAGKWYRYGGSPILTLNTVSSSLPMDRSTRTHKTSMLRSASLSLQYSKKPMVSSSQFRPPPPPGRPGPAAPPAVPYPSMNPSRLGGKYY